MKIRLWKLGSLEHKIYPSQMAINKFKEILSELQEEKENNIIWGPEITVQEINVDQDDLNILLEATDSDWKAKIVLSKLEQNDNI